MIPARKMDNISNNKLSNIYHCCVQKTGSQWIKAILSDELVLKKTGMSVYTYHKHLPNKGGETRKLTERTFDKPFPENCMLSPLYMDYSSYLSIPKPTYYRTFCMIRDPRDIIVSWYFSVKYTHALMGKIPEHRERLNKISLEEGLIYCLEYLYGYGLFEALKSWVKEPGDDLHIKLFRFEDTVDVNQRYSVFADLFSHCCIPITRREIKNLMKKYSFNQMQQKTKKSKQGISHYRKGVPGDWQEYFNERVNDVFKKHLGNLVKELGYLE